jgi:hypothetical protein
MLLSLPLLKYAFPVRFFLIIPADQYSTNREVQRLFSTSHLGAKGMVTRNKEEAKKSREPSIFVLP